MTIILNSFQRLFPGRAFPYHPYLEYNYRLSDFNANIRLHQNTLSVHLNVQWKDIDNEIKIGLIQSLLLKIFKERKTTPNIQLYHSFIRNIPILMPKTRTDPLLEQSFQRVNHHFFEQQAERPNLGWGEMAFRKLAHYNFHDDSIVVSSLFKEAAPEVLDYLMYHELLHKHHQFEHRNGRSAYHTKAFREAERRYPDYKRVEKQIHALIQKKRSRRFWQWW